MIQIMSTRDVGNSSVKCLVYGRAGAGKTVLIATAPNPIIISAESGLLSLRQFNIPYIEVKNMASLNEAWAWAANSNEARQFYTVGVDSISEIMEVLLADEKTKTKDPRKAYGEIIDKGLIISRSFRDLQNKFVVINAKEEYSKDDSTGVMRYGPMLPGNKLGQQLPYFFDEVFQLVVGSANGVEQRALRTRHSYQHEAKDRSGMLAEWEPPNLTQVFTKILK